MEFYDKLEALPAGALPQKPPTGKCMCHINRAAGIVIRIDLRGLILLNQKNKTLRYKFRSEHGNGQACCLAAEMANFLEESTRRKPQVKTLLLHQ